MKIFRHINIVDDSRKPKYIQIVDSIIENINDGNLSIGEKIPSINNLSEYKAGTYIIEAEYNN